MTFRFIKIWVLLLCGFLAAATFAQNSNSTIKGTVQDASGAVIPGATVSLTNVGTGQTLTTTSKADGFYTFPNLSPANYKISVTTQGFAEYVGVLTLRVSQDAEINPRLTAASVSTKVTVHDVTPVIDRVNPTISDVKNATAIETLPVQNRNILNVLAFSPGVVANNYGGSGGGYTRVNGIPGGSIDYLVDGQTMANRFTNELQQNSQPTPTFQEVKIITSNGDAQYSRPGVVELVTKSGTNKFHGQLYELNQNNHLEAGYGIFNPGPRKYLQHNEFGAQLGGPVWVPKIYNGRNKTFFFFDYEGIRQNANKPEQYLVPSKAMRGEGTQNGVADLSTLVDTNDAPVTVYDPLTTQADGFYTRTPFANNAIPANRLNPISQKILTASYGIPSPTVDLPLIDGNQNNYFPAAAKSTYRNNLYTAKVDQLFGPNRLAMRYTYTSSSALTPKGCCLLNPNNVLSGGHNGSIEFTQVISPRAINVVHAGIQYNHNYSGPVPISPPIIDQINSGLPAGYALPTYVNSNAWPGFAFNNYYLPNNTDTYWSTIDRDNPKDYPDQTVSVGDQFSLNRGNHQMLFGFDGSNYRVNYFEIGQPGGNYNFAGGYTALTDPASVTAGIYNVNVVDTGSGLADFLLGYGNQIFLHTYPHLHTRQTELAGYAQDNWRVSQRLTLNLGVRYTFYTAFEDSAKVQSTLDPNFQNGPNDFGQVVYAGPGPVPGGISAGQLAGFVAAGLPIESSTAAHYPSTLWNMPKNNWEPRVGFAYQLDPKTILRGGWGIYQWAMPLVDFQQMTRANAPFSVTAILHPGQIGGVDTDQFAAELEYPIAQDQYGGPQTPNPLGTLGTPSWQVTPSLIQQGSGFAMSPLNPNYKLQSVQEYSLTLSQELPQHIGFDLSYIGNHSYNLIQGDPINFEIPQLECPAMGLPANCQDPQRRAYPRFGESGSNGMEYYNYNGYSNTNELQARIQHTFGNGLLLQTAYTWQRTLTTTEGSFNSNVGGSAPIIPAALTPGYNLSAPLTSGASYKDRQRVMYAPDSNLPNKTFQLNAHYELPFGQGKKYLGNSHGVVNALVSGFNVSPFFLWHSGFYFAPGFSTFGSNVELAPGKNGILPEGQRSRSQWYNGSLYNPQNTACGGGACPYAGQTFIQVLGSNVDYRNNVPRNYMTGPGFNRMDATIYKLTPLYKGTVLDFEAQFLNIYNHVNLSLPHTNLPNDNITSSLAIDSANSGTTQPSDVPRTIQLQAKIVF